MLDEYDYYDFYEDRVEGVTNKVGGALNHNNIEEIAELTMKGIERSMKSRDIISEEITPRCTVVVTQKGVKEIPEYEEIVNKKKTRSGEEKELKVKKKKLKLFNADFEGKFSVNKGSRKVISGRFSS